MVKQPLITIVTITYNLIKNGRKDYIIQNIESVHNQTYKNIEQIIIDGASTDGTLELLRPYEEKGWIKTYSEPDQGIYDAMNKSLAKAQGKYIAFLNSDDSYCVNNAVELEVKKLEENFADVCYANSYIIDEKNGCSSVWNGYKTFFPLFGSFPNHQTLIVKKETIIEDGGFRVDIPECADNIYMFNMFLKGKKFIYLNEIITNFRNNGFSSTIQNKVKEKYIEYFYLKYAQFHNLTKTDCSYLFGHKFIELPKEKAIELGCKIENFDWQKEYFKILYDHFEVDNSRQIKQEIQQVQPQKITKKIKLLGFLTIFKYKQNSKNRRWYLFCLPVFKIKQKNELKRKCYLFGIPVLKIVENGN